jgi:Raf kinase inhibitor-like YbhB/YbcL family protein
MLFDVMKWGLFSLLVISLLIFACKESVEGINNVLTTDFNNTNITDAVVNNGTNGLSGVVNMKISSPVFVNLGMIPKLYSCQGQNINPPLEFSDIPEGAESLVLIMDDPDAPMGTWDHWILFNIPPTVTSIAQDSIPEMATQGLNSWPKNSYGGPCPPQGTHRYFFKLYALDRLLELDDTATKKDVEAAMNGHIIEKTQLIGLYRKE